MRVSDRWGHAISQSPWRALPAAGHSFSLQHRQGGRAGLQLSTPPLAGLQEMLGPLQQPADHSSVTTYQPKALQISEIRYPKICWHNRSAALYANADTLKHCPLPSPAPCSCAHSRLSHRWVAKLTLHSQHEGLPVPKQNLHLDHAVVSAEAQTCRAQRSAPTTSRETGETRLIC